MKTRLVVTTCMSLLVFLLSNPVLAMNQQSDVSRIPIQISNGNFEDLNYRAEGETVLDLTNLTIAVTIRMNPLQATQDQEKIHRAIHNIIRDQLNTSLATLLENRNLEYTRLLSDIPILAENVDRFLTDRVASTSVGMPMPNFYQAEFRMPFDGPGGIADFITSTGLDRPEEARQESHVVVLTEEPPVIQEPDDPPPQQVDDIPVPLDITEDKPIEAADESTIKAIEIIPPPPASALDWQDTPSTDRLLEGDVLEMASLLLSDMVARELSADSAKYSIAVKPHEGTTWKLYKPENTKDIETFDADLRLSGEITEASTMEEVTGGSPYKLTFHLTLLNIETGQPLMDKVYTREKRRNPTSDMDPYLELAYLITNEVLEEVKTHLQ